MKKLSRILVMFSWVFTSFNSAFANLTDPRIGERTRVLRGLTSLNEPAERLFVIGDSLSDSEGRYLHQTYGMLPPVNLYWEGRFANGPTWNQYLADALGIPHYSYAMGGARIHDMNKFIVLPATMSILWAASAFDQIKRIDQSHITFNDRDIVAVWIGSNDYILYPDAAKVELYVEQTKRIIKALIKRGASRLIVANLVDVSKTPFYSLGFGAMITTPKKLNAMIDRHNTLLSTMIEGIRERNQHAQITLIDAHAALGEILRSPENIGITDVKYPCIGGQLLPGGMGLGVLDVPSLPNIECVNPEQKFFWDAWHPSTKIHCIAAVKFMETLQNDGIVGYFNVDDAIRRCVNKI